MTDSHTTDLLFDRAPLGDLPEPVQADIRSHLELKSIRRGETVYALGDELAGLYFVVSGAVEVTDSRGALISTVEAGEAFGERGLLQQGFSVTYAMGVKPGQLAVLPKALFNELVMDQPGFADFFQISKTRSRTAPVIDITTRRVGEFMTRDPVTIRGDLTVSEAAVTMKEHKISCLLVVDGEALKGIVTSSDLVGRVLADKLDADTPVKHIMTLDPDTVDVNALGHDTLLMMARNRVGHLPVLQGDHLVGIVTRTDLLSHQASSASLMVIEIGRANGVDAVAAVVRRLPHLLVQLVSAGVRPEKVTRLMTDVGDAATRQFLLLAERELGPAPVPYLWLACGSQGRQEQTGVSDQDNCLILDDSVKPKHDAYFETLARRVSDALDQCGYFYCPGDMMATNARWRQPVRQWRAYFDGWVRQPEPMAQMLSSVMFDLRPIHGEVALFEGLHAATLQAARANSIFVAHMAAGSATSALPLGMLGGLSTIRSGTHKRAIDFKHAGVVPVVDLARLYALQGEILAVNTRSRLAAARELGLISESGAHDLIDAYDLICEMRLQHQANCIRAGKPADNFVLPARLSDLERDHLKRAFGVIKTMQSAALQGRGVLT
ncbi:MAG: DUF294 nucleotidyltransferase-like domain-containing protein [Burkholderiaceae bacterium]